MFLSLKSGQAATINKLLRPRGMYLRPTNVDKVYFAPVGDHSGSALTEAGFTDLLAAYDVEHDASLSECVIRSL